jgi:beta-lactamase regulating signal transducer with metallopeptidase domain
MRCGTTIPASDADTTELGAETKVLPVHTFLVWPEQLSGRLDDEQIEAMMTHKLVHARRVDNLTAALHMLVEAVFWFYPLVWWMERRLIEDREHTCDEAVVELGGNPDVYAESLLKTCRFCVESALRCRRYWSRIEETGCRHYDHAHTD